jgi:hypothetical protein
LWQVVKIWGVRRAHVEGVKVKSLKITFMLASIASVLLVAGVVSALSQQQPVEKEAFSPEGTERNTELELHGPRAFPSTGDKILVRGPL